MRPVSVPPARRVHGSQPCRTLWYRAVHRPQSTPSAPGAHDALPLCTPPRHVCTPPGQRLALKPPTGR